MEHFLQTLQAVPGLGPLVMFAGIFMIFLDGRKLYGIAMAAIEAKEKSKGKKKTKPAKPDMKFYYILPGLFLFAFGYEIVMA